MPAGGQNLGRQFDGLGEVTGKSAERGQKQISEVMALKALASREAMTKQARHQGFVFRQSHDAVADVPRRKNVQFFP